MITRSPDTTAADSPVSLITGAGSGIGRAVCEILAEAGHRLVLVGRDHGRLQETVDLIASRTAEPRDMLPAPADLSDPAQAIAAVEQTLERWDRVDNLVNNAGYAELAPIESTGEDLLHRTFAINVYAPAHLIARLWPVFREQGGGCIVNVSSVAAADPFPGFFAYAAAKAAVESLTRSAAGEGAGFGVRAFSVAPGAVETGMLRGLFSPEDLPPERTLDPADVARVICDCVLGRLEPSREPIRVQSP